MKAVILKCSPGYRFRFGSHAPDADTALNDTSSIIHSDTLFAAIVRTYADLFDDTDDFVRQFEKGVIKISSGFFCCKHKDNWIWFLPKPVSFDLAAVDDYKSFKKLAYISKELWETLQKPEELTAREDIAILNEKYVLLKKEIEGTNEVAWKCIRLFTTDIQPKVHLRKLSKEDSLYQLSTIEIADNKEYADNLKVHFYFLVEETKEFINEFTTKLNAVLEVLAESGIGGERCTIGKLDGIETVENWMIKNTDSGYGCTLSLLSPSKDDLSKLVYYQTLFRGGRRIGNNNGYTIQKSVRMISEGAIVKNGINGRIPDVTPDGFDGIYKRNGIPLTIPVSSSWIQ